MSTLFELARKSQEAQAVRLGIPVAREFSDAELAGSAELLAEAERELYGIDPRVESGCELSPLELQKLAEMNCKLIAFRVTVTLPDRTESINVLAAHACAAIILVVEQLFGEFDADKPEAFKLKVEPVKQRELKRAA